MAISEIVTESAALLRAAVKAEGTSLLAAPLAPAYYAGVGGTEAEPSHQRVQRRSIHVDLGHD